MFKRIDPNEINTIHGVEDYEKLSRLANAMADGWQGRAILAYDAGDGIHAVTGTHRVHAAIAAELPDIPVFVIDATGEREWIIELILANDDGERLDAARLDEDDGDAEIAAELMAGEVENNEA